MKILRTSLITIVVILACGIVVHSQYLNCSGGPLNCGGAASVSTMTIGDGATNAPSLSFTADLINGFYRPRANSIGYTSNSNPMWMLDAGNRIEHFTMDIAVGWTSSGTDPTLTADTSFSRLSAGVIGIGTGLSGGTGGIVEMLGMTVGSSVTTAASSTIPISAKGRVFLSSMSAEGGTKSTLCIDPATSEVETNAAATCTVSNLGMKDWVSDLSCKQAKAIVKGMRPAIFKDKDGRDSQRFGFAAEWTAKNDPRLVYYDKGKPHAVDYERYTAVLTRVLQCGMN
jgi:hypothetical protein